MRRPSGGAPGRCRLVRRGRPLRRRQIESDDERRVHSAHGVDLIRRAAKSRHVAAQQTKGFHRVGKQWLSASDESVQCSGPTVRMALYMFAGSMPSSGDNSSKVKFSHRSAAPASFISSMVRLTKGLKDGRPLPF